jgi:ribose transport system permease protein
MLKIDLSGFVKKYAAMLFLLFFVAFFAFASPYFLTGRNLVNIITQNTYILILGVGILFVMLGGGIDISLGYQMSLVGVVTGMCMVVFHLPVWLSVLLGLLMGTFLGFVNGMIISRIDVFPLIVTVATSAVFQGISYLISSGKAYNNFPEEFLLLTKTEVLGIPLDILLTLIIVLFASFVFSETVFGFRLIALGGNEEPARLAGVNTRRMTIMMYSICGLITAIGTMVMLSKANYHQSAFGPGTEILVMTAAVIGGVSFMGGGEGNVLGLVAGVFILAVIGNGMQLAGWGTYAQHLVKGAIFLAAVIFDQVRTNLSR